MVPGVTLARELDLATIRGALIDVHGAAIPAAGTAYERVMAHMLTLALELLPPGREREHARLVVAAYEDGLDASLALDARRAARARRALLQLVSRYDAQRAPAGGAA